MFNMASGIYSITHTETGKIYIGQSIDLDRRINAHKNWFENPVRNINRHLYNYAKKYGLSAFEFTIIEECCADDLDVREMHWYEVYKENTFNVRPSPVTNRGVKRSEEFCKENGERQKKRMEDPEKLEKHREMIRKRSQNEVWLQKMRKVTEDRVNNKEWLEKNQKMTSSKEVNDKRRITNFLKGNSKAVASYSPDNTFYDYFINVNEAVESVGGLRGNVVSCLQGRLATSYGFKWKYITNEEYLELNGGEILKKSKN
jgi:group I intron endonuclease